MQTTLNSAIKYKIHSYNSAVGVSKSANNNVFYDTYEQAYLKVLDYMRIDSRVGYVIMKTCAVIVPETPPVAHYVLADDEMVLSNHVTV